MRDEDRRAIVAPLGFCASIGCAALTFVQVRVVCEPLAVPAGLFVLAVLLGLDAIGWKLADILARMPTPRRGSQ